MTMSDTLSLLLVLSKWHGFECINCDWLEKNQMKVNFVLNSNKGLSIFFCFRSLKMPILPLLVEAWIISFLIKSSVAISKIKTNKLNVETKTYIQNSNRKRLFIKNKNRNKNCETVKTKTVFKTNKNKRQQRKNGIPCKCSWATRWFKIRVGASNG